MRSSKLKLNPDKTEVLLFGTRLHRKEFIKHFPAKLDVSVYDVNSQAPPPTFQIRVIQ